jgi:hypothetical protein
VPAGRRIGVRGSRTAFGHDKSEQELDELDDACKPRNAGTFFTSAPNDRAQISKDLCAMQARDAERNAEMLPATLRPDWPSE